jgi:hypothetical protein
MLSKSNYYILTGLRAYDFTKFEQEGRTMIIGILNKKILKKSFIFYTFALLAGLTVFILRGRGSSYIFF